MTNTGPPYNSYAAAASTIRSAPICLGFSVAMRIPVLMPGSTTTGWISKYLINALNRECMTLGTTLAMLIPLISRMDIPLIRNSSIMEIPNSSEVLCIFVVIRKLFLSVFPSNTPKVIFVFPTSTTNNITLFGNATQPSQAASPLLL